MNKLSTSLDQQELEWLDVFILERLDENTNTEGKDEGVLDVSELDGFFTAIISGPVMIPPSIWLPAVWGDFEPVWDNEQEVERVLSLMMRHMNDIATTLIEQSQYYEPIFMQRKVKGKTYTIVDEWCEGYKRGMGLTFDQWDTNGLDMKILLAPIMAFTGEQAMQLADKFNEVEIENLQKAIIPNAQQIHAYWLARRLAEAPITRSPIRRQQPRIGRNDACPCGSGKKYKKCCLH